MTDREKVITRLEDSLANNGCGFMDGIGELFAVSGEDLQNAIALLKAHESISEQDREDLDILRRVRDGKLAKALCRDYVIYNGEWYRSHKWDWPDNEPLEPRIIDGEPECGFCLYELRRDADSYCPCCGRKIKWE